MHALWARRRGFEVVHLERELEARGASVRNFGLVWVGARAGGAELELALQARLLWQALAQEVPGLHFRPSGSLQWRRTRPSFASSTRPGSEMMPGPAVGTAGRAGRPPGQSRALRRRGRGPSVRGGRHRRAPPTVGLLSAALVPAPAIAGFPAGRWSRCPTAPWLTTTASGTGATGCSCAPGATCSGLVARYVGRPRDGRVRLQMLETAPYPGELTTAVADGDSLRYYPAFDLPARPAWRLRTAVAAAHRGAAADGAAGRR